MGTCPFALNLWAVHDIIHWALGQTFMGTMDGFQGHRQGYMDPRMKECDLFPLPSFLFLPGFKFSA